MTRTRNIRRISLVCRLTDKGVAEVEIAKKIMADEGLIAPLDWHYIAFLQKKYCK